ncbi:MAG: DUF3800 domain-containing protein [Marinospirillum sp.]|uniref:DUF3800 domain-containing protein n=1 Tax=Marinospirillum sp. TaxID=2183934 RepID=UPI001A08A24B|nr:DUF3800 domain-containing protein [Marinospirillum sp.]MBE0507613.1 DUF3800 domain-containing protein [Marinospirillum sp.]
MTTYNVYCDESRHTSDPSQPYIVIGALQCPREEKRRIVGRLHGLMTKHGIKTEFGWKKASPNKAEFYLSLIQLFAEEQCLSFRCVVVDRRQLDHEQWNNGDKELGFYKLYYQLLVHWLQPGDTYHIYLDWQQNAASGRFEELRQILAHKLMGRAKIACLEPVESHNQPLIQLADLLMGAVGYDWNDMQSRSNASVFKVQYAGHLAKAVGKSGLRFTTPKTERKFNIFNWQGR